MAYNILEQRYNRVTRLLNYMLSEGNYYKVIQAYYIISLINERKQELFNKKQNHINSIR
jgi:hypothetical protein